MNDCENTHVLNIFVLHFLYVVYTFIYIYWYYTRIWTVYAIYIYIRCLHWINVYTYSILVTGLVCVSWVLKEMHAVYYYLLLHQRLGDGGYMYWNVPLAVVSQYSRQRRWKWFHFVLFLIRLTYIVPYLLYSLIPGLHLISARAVHFTRFIIKYLGYMPM